MCHILKCGAKDVMCPLAESNLIAVSLTVAHNWAVLPVFALLTRAAAQVGLMLFWCSLGGHLQEQCGPFPGARAHGLSPLRTSVSQHSRADHRPARPMSCCAAPAPVVEYFQHSWPTLYDAAPAPAVYAALALVVVYIDSGPAVCNAYQRQQWLPHQVLQLWFTTSTPSVTTVRQLLSRNASPAPALHAAPSPTVWWTAPAPAVNYAAPAPAVYTASGLWLATSLLRQRHATLWQRLQWWRISPTCCAHRFSASGKLRRTSSYHGFHFQRQQ